MFDLVGFLKKNGIKKTNRDLAGELRLEIKTLYNWKNNKKKQRLLKLIAKGYLFEKLEQDIKELQD